MTQPTPTSRPSFSSDDVDLTQVLGVLRRDWKPLLLVPLVLSGVTYALFSRQAPVYEASTSLMATLPDNSNRVLSGASVNASQLPQGAVEEVLHSRNTVARIEKTVMASALPDKVKQEIKTSLQTELARESYKRVSVKARVDQYQRGVYDLKASAETPEAARVLADAAARALLQWDAERARTGVTRARRNIQEQLDNITRRLQTLPSGSVEQQSLIAARGQLELDLSQATVFEEGATGSLTLLKEANAPSVPVAPKPRRNAALVFLLSLFAGSGLALLLDSLRRKVRSTTDLISLGVPVLGELPRAKQSKRSTIVQAARSGELYEAIGFVRVNLSTAVPHTPAVMTVSSARPSEGKSALVAATAASYAATNKQVLIIDADMHRPMQQEYWPIGGRPWMALPGTTEPHQTDIAQAIEHPERASAVDLGGHIHLLPAGNSARQAAALLNDSRLPDLLRLWASAYDVVLIDTPPILALSDAYTVAAHTDGLLLVVESGETSLPEVQRAVHNTQTTGVKLLGVVINKVNRGQQSYYYNYTYSKTPA